MRFIVIATLLAVAAASPLASGPPPGYGGEDGHEGDDGYGGGDGGYGGQRGGYQPCSKAGFFGNAATCCSFDIIGAASLGCKPPARNPRSPEEFKALCGKKKPKCCFVDATGGIVNAICPTPVGF
ncbi:uncharacterized protein LMH87_008689 [Akanthomyces muscarius]|uniref:Hydrophobin n=1 Tax=Akanthomyces muscarius TaxID=2231603 RepID=A0A9W8UM78_AKAMU|nr:uncharacterized protein LMH87_008689 [Akanthomyces muscarius]KAJ4158150.1 hypothetical protein LMH87_008689 [Akanthomyces muscarius]